MSKAVLMSIQPKWCELIASGEKTFELRKTFPRLHSLYVPFKVYIYQTKPKERLVEVMREGDTLYGETYHGKPAFIKTTESIYPLHGTYGRWQKVIGEFVCDNIETVLQCNSGWVRENACVSKDEFFDYLGIPRDTHLGYNKKVYAWHISDLVIYDQPKELSEFTKPCTRDCGLCKHYERGNFDDPPGCAWNDGFITRPPQSWMYVEELK